MKTFRLVILGIDLPQSENEEFHDDGFVESIREYKIRLLRDYHSYQPEEELNKQVFGTHGQFWVGSKIIRRIAYLDQKDDARNINTRAHEETHVLAESGYIDLLTDKILQDLGISLDLSLMLRFDQKDLVSEIGGIYPLKILKIDPRNIEQFRDKTYKTALEMYEEAFQKAR
jgi:hypothetical protein